MVERRHSSEVKETPNPPDPNYLEVLQGDLRELRKENAMLRLELSLLKISLNSANRVCKKLLEMA